MNLMGVSIFILVNGLKYGNAPASFKFVRNDDVTFLGNGNLQRDWRQIAVGDRYHMRAR